MFVSPIITQDLFTDLPENFLLRSSIELRNFLTLDQRLMLKFSFKTKDKNMNVLI